MRDDFAKKKGLGLAQGMAHSGKMPASRATSGTTQEYVPDRDGGAYDEPAPWKGGDAGFENMGYPQSQRGKDGPQSRSGDDNWEPPQGRDGDAAEEDGFRDDLKQDMQNEEADGQDPFDDRRREAFRQKWIKRAKQSGMSDEEAAAFVDDAMNNRDY